MADIGLPLESEFYPTQNMGAAKSVVIFLHGFGASGADLINIAAYLSKILPDTAFYGPDAPEDCEMVSFGFQWFSMDKTDPQMYRRSPSTLPLALEGMHAGVETCAPIINDFINAVLERHNLPPEKLALFCFSQGTMMGLHIALHRKEPLAGVLGFSGALTGPDLIPKDKTHPPIRLIHGAADDVVPAKAMTLARDALLNHNVDVKTHIRPTLGHGIDDGGLFIARDFLVEIFS